MLLPGAIDYNKIISIKEKLLDGWRTKQLTEKRNTIHVSDIIHCKRATCFRRIDEDPPQANAKQIKYMLGGEIKHRVLQSLLGDDFEYEKEIRYKNCIGHPDAVHKETGVVVEFKITESVYVLEKPYETHIDQIKAYMSILNSEYGKLLYLLLGNSSSIKESDFFKEYLITFDYRAERDEILKKLEADTIELANGINIRNPAAVGHIARDPRYLRYGKNNWMCKSCPYESRCTNMRRDAGERVQ